MNSSLLFGFKDLVNSSSSRTSLLDLTSILFKDSYLKSLSPKRYNFYIKFVNGLANPEVLEKFFYKTKDAKLYKQELNEKISKFADLVKKLYQNLNENEANQIRDNLINSIKDKYNLSDEAVSKLKEMINNNKKGGASLNKGAEPMQNFINVVKKELPEIQTSTGVKSVDELLISDNKKDQSSTKSKADINKKAKIIYETYKDDVNPELLKIKMIDRIIFIGVTFLIRYISLLIIKWGLDTNLIGTFHKAFFYYCIIYLIIFTFITMFVNVIIAYPILDLFSNTSIINIPNVFYYFYIYSNGSWRLLIHIIFIIIILFIPYIISVDNIDLKRITKDEINISVNFEKKEKILNSISTFSLIIWVMTSIISIKF